MSLKRDLIIEATCDLMEAQGYHATGLNQILAESGAPKGSLYYYFPSGKEELGIEAIKRSSSSIERRIRSVMDEIEDPIEAITAFISRLAAHVAASGFRAGGPITAIAVEAASTNESLRVACLQAYQSWQIAFASKLTAGGFNERRAARFASVIIAMLEGGIILSRTARTAQPLLDVATEVEALLSCQAADTRDD